MPVLAPPLLAFAPKPVGATAGSWTTAGTSCRWPLSCSLPSWRMTGRPIASRVTPPGLSWADRRGRKICRANGLGLVSPSLSSSRLPNRRGCTVMRVSIASESLPPPAASSRAGGREPSGFAGKVEPPPSRAASSARQANDIHVPISAIARRRTTILKPLSSASFALFARRGRVGCGTGRRTIVPAQEQRLQRRHDHQQDDRPDEHAADDDGCQRPLHLAADAGRHRRRQ